MDRDITLFPEKARIGVAIFSRNDQDTIPSVILLCRQYSGDIKVFDDGSEDRTREMAELAGAEVNPKRKKRGKGRGLREAFEWARFKRFDVLITMDANGKYDPGIIPFLAEPVIKKKADIAIGSKGFTYEGKSRKSLSWQIGNWMTKRARRSRISTPIYDKRSPFRAYHKRTFKSFDLETEKDIQEIELLEQADSKKMVITEVPMKAIYGQLERKDLGMGNWMLTRVSKMLKLLHIDSPLRLSIIGSSIVIILASLAAVYSKVNYPHHEFLPPGGTYIVMVLFALSGFILLNGIIFEALSHVGENLVKYLHRNDRIKLEYDPLKGFQR